MRWQTLTIVSCLLLTACYRNSDKQLKERVQRLESQVRELSERQVVQATASPALPSSSATASPQSETAVLTGSAFINRRSGDSTILRALHIYLCDPWFAALYRQRMKSYYSSDGIGPAAFELDYVLLQPEVAKYVKAETTTDVNGKYEIRNVAPGRYFVHAKLATAQSVVDWLVESKLEKGTTTLDLTNDNAEHIVNASR